MRGEAEGEITRGGREREVEVRLDRARERGEKRRRTDVESR